MNLWLGFALPFSLDSVSMTFCLFDSRMAFIWGTRSFKAGLFFMDGGLRHLDFLVKR